MFKFILSPLLTVMICSVAFAENEGVYTFKEPILIGPEQAVFEQNLGDVVEESSRFNHYENQSLRSFSSVFVEGVDQRFLDLNFNGFSLRDPSSPTGVFNVGALSSLNSSNLILEGGAALNIESAKVEKTIAAASLSNLGEGGVSAVSGSCKLGSCQSIEASFERGGGYSQLSSGKEKDYFEQVTVSGSKSIATGETIFTSRFLYYGQKLDLDSIAPLSASSLESQSAEALNSVFFVGQDFDFSSNHRLMLSYTHSYRNQRDQPLALSFRQRGEVLESAYSYKNNLKLKVFQERYDLYSSSDTDTGVNAQKKIVIGDVVLDLSLGKTRLRSLNWSSEVGYKNLVIFYKGLPPSLFQQSYNNQFSLSGELDSQEFLGFRYSKAINLSLLDLKWNISYSRIYRYVDFDQLNNSYENLGEVENFFMGLKFVKGPLSFLVQNQVARQVLDIKRDLPRRAPWTLGLRYEKKINRLWRLHGGVRWLSKRQAFDQSELGAAWMSDLRLSYKNLTLNCTNVFSDREEVFRNLGRKPLSIRVSYQKNF